MSSQAVSAEEFYTGIARYMDTVDPDWAEEGWQAQIARERETLRRVLGEARGRSALDCSCGGGGQAIPLAQLGWRVTATDVTDDALETARCRARRQGRVAAMLTGLSNASYPPLLTSSRGSAATEGSRQMHRQADNVPFGSRSNAVGCASRGDSSLRSE